MGILKEDFFGTSAELSLVVFSVSLAGLLVEVLIVSLAGLLIEVLIISLTALLVKLLIVIFTGLLIVHLLVVFSVWLQVTSNHFLFGLAGISTTVVTGGNSAEGFIGVVGISTESLLGTAFLSLIILRGFVALVAAFCFLFLVGNVSKGRFAKPLATTSLVIRTIGMQFFGCSGISMSRIAQFMENMEC